MKAFVKLAVTALIAAVRIMQIVLARDGTTAQSLADAADPLDIPALQAINASLEGRTEKLRNPHPATSLAWLSWIVGRLGGWAGYASKGYKPAGPKTVHRGLLRLDGMISGWNLAHRSALVQLRSPLREGPVGEGSRESRRLRPWYKPNHISPSLRACISVRSVQVEPLSHDLSPSQVKDWPVISTNRQRFSRPLWSSPIWTISAPTARPIWRVSTGRRGSNQVMRHASIAGVVPGRRTWSHRRATPRTAQRRAEGPSRRIDPHVLNSSSAEHPAEVQFGLRAADRADRTGGKSDVQPPGPDEPAVQRQLRRQGFIRAGRVERVQHRRRVRVVSVKHRPILRSPTVL